MISNRKCQVQNHENSQVSYICTYAACDINIWACEQCIQEQHHNHGLEQVMKQQEFLNLVNLQKQIIEEKNDNDSQFIQSCLKDLNQFIELIKALKESLLKDLNTIDKQHNIDFLIYLQKIASRDFLQLDDQLITDFIGLKDYLSRLTNNECDIRMQQQTLNNIKQQYQEIKQFIQDHEQQYIKQQELLKKEIKKITYQKIEYISHLQLQPETEYEYRFYGSQISFNEKYLVVLQGNNKIQIYNLETKQIIKCIETPDQMTACIFSSQYLFCGDRQGWLFCYDVNNDFNEKYKKSLHTSSINYIMFMDDLITCSDDCSITISGEDKLQIIKNAHKDKINGLDYDQQKELIISCANDSFIKFHNKNTFELVISQKLSKDSNGSIQQIKLVSDNKNLIVSQYDKIYLVFIDYYNRNFQIIKQHDCDTYSFSITNFDTRIIRIMKHTVEIQDPQFNIRNTS